MKSMNLVRNRRGRPQKFGRPSRAVTLTLPEDVIAALSAVDHDLGRAVVRLSQPLAADKVSRRPAELSTHKDSAVIVVTSAQSLERMPGVTLVPLPDGRALIALDESMSIQEFELQVRDALEQSGRVATQERSLLASIVEILTAARHTKGLTVHRRSIIVLKSTRRRRLAAS